MNTILNLQSERESRKTQEVNQKANESNILQSFLNVKQPKQRRASMFTSNATLTIVQPQTTHERLKSNLMKHKEKMFVWSQSRFDTVCKSKRTAAAMNRQLSDGVYSPMTTQQGQP